MKQIICLNFNNSNEQMMQSITTEYQIHYSSSVRDAILYMVDNPEVSHLVFHFKGSSSEYQQTVKIIQEINSFLPLILVPEQNNETITDTFRENPNVIVITPRSELSKILKNTAPNRRKANRILWPLRASFYNTENTSLVETGQVISLSILGAYIKTPNLDLLTHESIMLEIAFTDFKFLVEGKIKHTTRTMNKNLPLGFAVEFYHISPATATYINSLINDKLLHALIDHTQQV